MPIWRFATALLVTALIATACSSNEPAALPATPTPAPVVEATPVPPTATAVPPTPTPVPPTVEPTAVPTATVAPLPVVNDVNFRDVAPGVGPFNYPVKGIELIANDIEAEALWAVVELNNTLARVYDTGSTTGIPSLERLNSRELVHEDFVADLETVAGANRITFGEQSALTEVSITREPAALILTLCYQLAFDEFDASNVVTRSAANTTLRSYTFTANGPGVQLTAFRKEPVGEGLLPCEAPTAEPTVVPLPTSNDVNFRDVAPGVGPFNYPVKGIDLIANDLEAEALWAVVEFNNTIAKTYDTGSPAGSPNWEVLLALGLIPKEFAADVDGLVGGDRVVYSEDSAFAEVAITREEAALVLRICHQLSFDELDTSGSVTRSAANTSERLYTFSGNGARLQLTGLEIKFVAEGLVSCDL